MKIKKIQKCYIDINIKYGPSFEYELPETFDQFRNDCIKKGYLLSKGELSYINSKSQKIIIKSRNDYISLLRNVQESKKKLKLIFEKEVLDSFISDLDFIKIQNVYSDLNTDESILELSKSFNMNELNEIIEEDDDKYYYTNVINLIENIFKKKYFLEMIIKIKGKQFFEKKFGKERLEYIPENKISSSINSEYKIPSLNNLLKNCKINLIRNNEEILNNLYNHYEQIEEYRNNNSIYQTMLNSNSRISFLKKENNNMKNMNEKIYESEIIQNSYFYECNYCHINPIKNKRFKCNKCINYNLCETCEEKNSQILFHPHSEFILIRVNESILSENPYSYQCLTKNLVFNINKENIVNDKIIINNILIKNNFLLPWPGNNSTFFKCDKSLSTIFCEKIYLPNLVLGSTTNIDFIFQKANKIPEGKYKCICNFFVENVKYGEPIELSINIF